jgi:gamma-glutamyltranspeptidase/glutathione hydrolase
MILMEELLIAEGFDLAKISEADRIHMMVEAKKIAFQDRYELLGDPEYIDFDLEKLFAVDSINSRRSRIDMSKANTSAVRYNQEGSDTTYFLTADRDGNAVSWIQSVFHGFGASWAIPGTGIIMNNRLTGFSLDPKSPNFIAPGRRPAHTLNAWIATYSDGSLAHVGGTPGANIQVQTNFQLITNAIDLSLLPQENAEAPRWQHLNGPSYSDAEENFDGVLQIEGRISQEILTELRNRGHEVQELPPFGHGSSVQLLSTTESGSFVLGSDPRTEGQAAGF